MGRTPRNPWAALAQAAQAQLTRAKALGKSLDSRVKKKLAASEEWTLDEDFRRDFAAVTAALQHAGNSLARALEGGAKALGGMTDAQLEAQFDVEIVRSAISLSDEDWQVMCDARAKARAR